MGERGKLRPVLKVKGTDLSYQWPMGTTRRERDYITRRADAVCSNDLQKIKWLEANAWKYLTPKGI